jgi:hypothetical protein
VIEKSTKRGSQRERKIKAENLKKEGTAKMVTSERRTTKRYWLKMPVMVTEILNCVAKLEY